MAVDGLEGNIEPALRQTAQQVTRVLPGEVFAYARVIVEIRRYAQFVARLDDGWIRLAGRLIRCVHFLHHDAVAPTDGCGGKQG